MSRQYKLDVTPADEAEKLWRDLQYHHKVATESGEPSAWAKVGTLVPIVQIAYQRAQVWATTRIIDGYQQSKKGEDDDITF